LIGACGRININERTSLLPPHVYLSCISFAHKIYYNQDELGRIRDKTERESVSEYPTGRRGEEKDQDQLLIFKEKLARSEEVIEDLKTRLEEAYDREASSKDKVNELDRRSSLTYLSLLSLLLSLTYLSS
jgi:hypothetical protein